MTDENLNTETNTEAMPDSAAPVVATPASVTAPVAPAPAEKTLTQNEVNSLVGSVRRESYEKGKREGLTDVQQPTSAPPAILSSGGAPVSDERLRTMITEEAQKMAEMQTAQNVVTQFVQKMEKGPELYEDFNDTVAQLNLPSIPPIINYANSMSNTADIMYELGKNPSKVASLMSVIHYTPHLAAQEFQKLSDSIISNQEATKAQKAKEPLSQVESSYTGIDSGNASVSDLRKQDWLR